MKDKMQLKGKLKMYMQWPIIMMVLLVAMNIWIYLIDKKAGFTMSIFIVIYIFIAAVLYFYNRSMVLADLVQFASQYRGVQNTLLKKLAIPYMLIADDGIASFLRSVFCTPLY